MGFGRFLPQVVGIVGLGDIGLRSERSEFLDRHVSDAQGRHSSGKIGKLWKTIFFSQKISWEFNLTDTSERLQVA